MIFDLSLPIFPDMPVYPGDQNVIFTPTLTHESCGYNVHYVSLSTHTGTHIDAPAHTSRDGEAVDTDRVLDACIGEALVVNVSDRLVDNEIRPSSLENALTGVKKGERILLATGWSDQFGKDEYYRDFPSLSEELTDILVQRSIALVGLETPSVHSVKDDSIHRKLLSAGIIIVEGLARLKELGEGRVFFSAAPLKLRDLDGSPVRAYGIRP